MITISGAGSYRYDYVARVARAPHPRVFFVTSGQTRATTAAVDKNAVIARQKEVVARLLAQVERQPDDFDLQDELEAAQDSLALFEQWERDPQFVNGLKLRLAELDAMENPNLDTQVQMMKYARQLEILNRAT